MPFREKKIKSGIIQEVEIYPITEKDKKQPRAKKIKESQPKQKKINEKNARKQLNRLIDTNFTDDDLSLCLTYTELTLPQSEEEARRDITNFLRRVRRLKIKLGLTPLKYIAIIEYKEADEKTKEVRIHHHIIINGGIDRDEIEKLWQKGRCNADRLKADNNGYEALAKYISKDPKGSKRWTQSKNLKQPIIQINDSKFTKRKVEKLTNYSNIDMIEKLYPGYQLVDFKVSINDVTAAPHIYIKMRQIEKRLEKKRN